ncbi:VanZ family protein [Lysobacter sp. GX 14042]|uniref:VanZ family protein n=1 Tax=Lysobacter sp. GX 14042 TaxID=2907155 RepID=UPI001F2C0520|nr:VanZ family protein [Lysobacter sp. GX 14042]MCE7033443.1 VanZ family protein [Lysobacter sp. GX 14042]
MLRNFHRPWLWVAGWLALLALVAAGSLMPASDLPQVQLPGVDKIQHAAAHAVLASYAMMLFATRRAQGWAVVGLLAYGVGIEAAQATLTADRMAEWTDVLANAAGTAVGVALTRRRPALLMQRIDRWLAGAAGRGERPPSCPE